MISDVISTVARELDTAKMVEKLRRPDGQVDVVLDTDTYNEIDDQYALAYLLRSRDKLKVKAIYAAPFVNDKAENPGIGMEKSFDEIFKILNLMEENTKEYSILKGSRGFLPCETEPVISEAAEDLATRAMQYSEDKPLYVIAIGAITNIASAILINPEIIRHIVVVWLGGHALHWPNNKEFNLRQDVASARVVFGCGVPLVQLPCMGVVSAFTTSGPELKYHLSNKNKLCDYLIDVTEKEARSKGGGDTWTRAIWDVTAVAWLLGNDFVDDLLIHSPIPEYDHHYSHDLRRHFIKYVYNINRDALMHDLFCKLIV